MSVSFLTTVTVCHCWHGDSKSRQKLLSKVNSNIYELNINSFQNTKTQFCRNVFFGLSHIGFFTAPSPNFTLVLFLLSAMFVPGDIKHASHYMGVRLMFSRLKEEKEKWITCYLGFQCIWKWSCGFLLLGRKPEDASFEQLEFKREAKE